MLLTLAHLQPLLPVLLPDLLLVMRGRVRCKESKEKQEMQQQEAAGQLLVMLPDQEGSLVAELED